LRGGPQLFYLFQEPCTTGGVWTYTAPSSCGKPGIDVSLVFRGFKPLALTIDSSRLTVEADFRPMLKAYVNTMSIREYSRAFRYSAHHMYASHHVCFSENEFAMADITGDMLNEWNVMELPGENCILRLKCGI
jgi:hypothetical protein